MACRWRLWRALVCLALLVPASPALALDLVRVGLPTAVEIPYAPVVAADELGLYAEQGITVEITSYRGAGAAQEALAAGAADIVNLIPSGAAVARSKGLDELIVGCGPQITPDGWYLLVRADSRVHSLKDLAGKKIAVTSKNSTSDFYALWAARKGGIAVQTIPVGGNSWPTLKSGQVDAMVSSAAVALQLELSHESRILVDYRSEMEPNIPECWVAPTAFIGAHAAAVKGFLVAVNRATLHMQQDEAYTLAFLSRYLDEKNDAYLKAGYQRIVMTLTTDGKVDLGALGNSLALAQLAGIADLPPPETLVAAFALAPPDAGASP
jgi:ABC-type nitrate/sulfonate/bicarbonate transport system substrate-binding protein